jgi:hypothetical protein
VLRAFVLDRNERRNIIAERAFGQAQTSIMLS